MILVSPSCWVLYTHQRKKKFVEFKKILDGGSIVDKPFELWDGDLKCVIQTNLELFIVWGVDVFVIPIFNVLVNNSKKRRIEVFASNEDTLTQDHKMSP